MLFDTTFGPLRFIKTVFFPFAPTRLFTWEQTWGPALYWTTQSNASNHLLWFWDLVAHQSATTPTSVSVGTGGCYGSSPFDPVF